MPLTERFPWVDFIGDISVSDFEKVPNPRVFKCHNHSPQEMDNLIFKGITFKLSLKQTLPVKILYVISILQNSVDNVRITRKFLEIYDK